MCQGDAPVTAGFVKGRYVARLAQNESEVSACLAFRHACFFGTQGRDEDPFDAAWAHMMVRDGADGPLVCTFRIRVSEAADILTGYAGQFYDLARLSRIAGPCIEIGRFCTDPARPDPHILRVAWGAVTQLVDAHAATMLFGCASFRGTDPQRYAGQFQTLFDRHLGPGHLLPGRRSTDHVVLETLSGAPRHPMPPLLRTYLAMGGWVSDHAVIDREMNTMHVLTVVEIAKIPPARVKALRALV